MPNTAIPARRRMQPIVAWRAMQELLKDKEDTSQVFVIVRALGGGELTRNCKRFAKSEVGARILRDETDLLDTIANREALAAMPEGSLGRAYLNFVGAENISAEGLVDASREGGDMGEGFTDEENIFRRRTRDMHDLWHVVNGYGRDEVGELSLLAFSYSQLKNLGIRFIIWMGLRETRKRMPGVPVANAVREGFRNGRNAEWLAAVDWEAMLPRPIDEVRAELGFARPVAYEHVVDVLREHGREGYETDPLGPLPQPA